MGCVFLWVHNVIMSGLFQPILAKQLKPCHRIQLPPDLLHPPPPSSPPNYVSPSAPKPSHLLTPPSTTLTFWLPDYWRHIQEPQSSHLCCLQWLVEAEGSSPLTSHQRVEQCNPGNGRRWWRRVALVESKGACSQLEFVLFSKPEHDDCVSDILSLAAIRPWQKKKNSRGKLY